MRPWQFNIMYGVAVLGAVVLFGGPYVGLDVNPSVTQLSGYSAILAYVLGHRSQWVSKRLRGRHIPEEDEDDE